MGVYVCEDHRKGGRGSLLFKPWKLTDWYFPLWSADCVCAAWNKDPSLRKYPRDHHLHKTPSHTTSSFLCLAHTSISRMYLLKLHCTHLTLTHHPHQQSTASAQCKLTAEGDGREKHFMNMESRCRSLYLQINNSIFHNMLGAPDWLGFR